VIAAAGALRVVVGARPTSAPSLDVLGAVLGSAALVAVVEACAASATAGWSAPFVLVLVGSGLFALMLFVWREARAASPLLPLRIVLDRARGGAYLSVICAIVGMFGAFLLLTYELQVVLRYPPLLSGLAFLPLSSAAMIGSGVIASRLLTRVSPRMLMVPGFLVAAAGMALLSQLQPSGGYLNVILPAELLLGLGIGCVMMPSTSIATAGVDPRDAGIASASLNTSQQVGASLGTALLNTVAAATTAAFLVANPGAARPEALVHGYAAAASVGAAVLVVGGLVAASLITTRTPATTPLRSGRVAA
jgi:MFS transporter